MPDTHHTLVEAPLDGRKIGTARKAFRAAARLRSFRFAVNGIRLLVREEHNAWVHLAASIAVIAIGLALGLDLSDWRWIILAMALVWAAEALNTALEQLCNRASPDTDPIIKVVKDVAAGAVLIVAVAAALIGVATFLPYLQRTPPALTCERIAR